MPCILNINFENREALPSVAYKTWVRHGSPFHTVIPAVVGAPATRQDKWGNSMVEGSALQGPGRNIANGGRTTKSLFIATLSRP
jgi:hypothetical protein